MAELTIHPRGTEESYLSGRGTQGMTISIVFTSLATFFVLARFYTRLWLIKRVEANDWMIMIALILSFVFMGLDIAEAFNGMGMHGAALPPHIIRKQMKIFWVTIPFYNAALLCAKAAILLQYYAVFSTKRMRITCQVMLTMLAVYGIWCIVSAFLNCVPVAKFWNPSIPGFCLSSKGLWFSNASIHIATDLAILAIPIPSLLALFLPKRQKAALIAIFALGGFVCVTSICRLVSLKRIADSSDPTYDNVGAASWSAIECNVGIICACLPTLRPLISCIIPRLLSTVGDAEDTAPLSGRQTYWHSSRGGSTLGKHHDIEAQELPTLGPRIMVDRKQSVTEEPRRHIEAASVRTEITASPSTSSPSPRNGDSPENR